MSKKVRKSKKSVSKPGFSPEAFVDRGIKNLKKAAKVNRLATKKLQAGYKAKDAEEFEAKADDLWHDLADNREYSRILAENRDSDALLYALSETTPLLTEEQLASRREDYIRMLDKYGPVDAEKHWLDRFLGKVARWFSRN